MPFHRPVGIKKKYPHRSARIATIVVIYCPDAQVDNIIAIDIWQRGYRKAENITITQNTGEVAFRIAYLLMPLHRSIAIKKKYPHCSTTSTTIIITWCPNGYVGYAIAIEVP